MKILRQTTEKYKVDKEENITVRNILELEPRSWSLESVQVK